MKPTNILAGISLMAFFTANISMADGVREWISATNGRIPLDAKSYGVEQSPGNEPLFICRARYADKGKIAGMHPGKIRSEFNGCNIAYGGADITVPDYEVLTSPVTWVAAANGEVPIDAFVAGEEGLQDGGQKLFVCRAIYPAGTTGLHIGKLRPEFGACNFSWGGQEVQVAHYEVAVSL